MITVQIDYLRVVCMVIPLCICNIVPLAWASLTVPYIWYLVCDDTKYVLPMYLALPLWYIMWIVGRAIVVQAILFSQLPWKFPYVLLKVHAVAAIVFLLVFLLLTAMELSTFGSEMRSFRTQ